MVLLVNSLIILVLLANSKISVHANNLSICDQEVYRISGSLNIIGILKLHTNENCSDVNPHTQQMAQNFIAATEAIRVMNFIPKIDIGLTIFDSCLTEENGGKILQLDCMTLLEIGSMVGGVSNKNIDNTQINFPVSQIDHHLPYKPLMKIAAKVLLDLQWMPIDYLITEKESIRNELLKALADLHICVYNAYNIHEKGKIESGGTVVIAGDFAFIKSLTNLPKSNIFVVPMDGLYDPLPELKDHKSLILLGTKVDTPSLDSYNLNYTNYGGETREKEVHQLSKSKSSLSQLQMVANLVTLVRMAKIRMQTVCNNFSLCPQLPKTVLQQLPNFTQLDGINSILYQLKVLQLDSRNFEAAVLLEQNENLVKLGTVKIKKFQWFLETNMTINKKSLTCKDSGVNCSECYNYKTKYIEALEDGIVIILRGEAWVAALLSVSAVGVISCMAIGIFILVRICKKDMLEGNPGFSFLMLISLIFMYCGILPFSFKILDDHHYYRSILCGLKVIGTSLSYCLVFSVMLARSLMLASCDEDGGFMSHVNGYLQTVLCFFIAAVQIALTLQFWAMNWFFSDKEQCTAMTEGPLFLYLLSYDMFLLLLLICVSPFIMKSKRNYQEGGYFASATLLCCIIWITWSTNYILFPEYADIFTCSGMVATATAILVVVFIPRTYLMMTGIVRDHIVSTLPSLGHTTATSIVDVNYRSTQALYDSVGAPGGQINPNYYAERPTTPSTSKMEDRLDPNPYERYDRSPSPRNVTRF